MKLFWYIILAAVLFLTGGCGSPFLSQADSALKRGEYDTALINVDKLLHSGGSEKEVAKAKEIQQQAGMGKRGQTSNQIQTDLADQRFDSARARLDKLRDLAFLPDNFEYTVKVESLITRRQYEFAFDTLQHRRDLRNLDSMMVQLKRSLANLPGASSWVDLRGIPNTTSIDSMIDASMRSAMQQIRAAEEMRKNALPTGSDHPDQ